MPSAFENWFRKLHMYLGLLFLFFLWLFCLSGVVLNHPKWQFTGFWENRAQTPYEQRITRPAEQNSLRLARDVMAQLDLHGEVSVNDAKQPSPDGVAFQVSRPGHIYDVKADFRSGVAKVNHTQVNGWGVMNMLHHWTGVKRGEPDRRQTWWATGIWRFSMDALSVSLAFMVLSGIYLRYRRVRRPLGLTVSLGLGIVVLSCFLFL